MILRRKKLIDANKLLYVIMYTDNIIIKDIMIGKSI